jgi:hypothetical protein
MNKNAPLKGFPSHSNYDAKSFSDEIGLEHLELLEEL